MIFGKSRILNKLGRWIYGKPGLGNPGNFAYTIVNQDTIRFTWTEADGATGYRIYDENDELIADVGNVLYWEESGYIFNQPKVRKLQAYLEDTLSAEIPIVTAVILLPAPILSVETYKHSKITWQWTKSNEYAVGYRIYNENDELIADVGNALSYEEVGLDADTTYRRYVVAYASNDFESPSPIATQTTLAVPVPQVFAASVDDSHQITFTWDSPDSDLDGFKIYDSRDTLIADIPGASSELVTINGFTPNTEFSFYIVAHYKGKTSEHSNDRVVITFASNPTIDELVVLNNMDAGIGILINGYDNPSNTIYEIYCFTTGETIYVGTELYFAHRYLTIDTTYQYQVRAKNLGGIYTGYSSIATKKCTQPARIQLTGGITQVFSTAVTIDLVAPEGYTSGMIIADSVNNGICSVVNNEFQDNYAYEHGVSNYVKKGLQPYTSFLSYMLPNKYGEIELQVVFMNSEGEFTPKYTTKVTYFKALERPQLYAGQTLDGVKIEAINLKPGGYGTVSSSHLFDGIDETYASKAITGFDKSLITVINGNSLIVYDDNWNCMTHIEMTKVYTGICFDSSQNCLLLSTGTTIEKWMLSDNGYSLIDLKETLSIGGLETMCTDSNYIYSISNDGIISRWAIADGYKDTDTVDIKLLTSNSINNKGIDYYNGTLYIGSENGYLHVIDILDWYNPKLSCEINTNLSEINKLFIDGFYIYASKNGELSNYRYNLPPRIDIYKSIDNTDFSLFAEDVALKIMDITENADVPPRPTITSTSHAVSTPSSDTTIDIGITNNTTGVYRNVYYYATAHDPYGHSTNIGNTVAVSLYVLIEGYVVIWDGHPATIPGTLPNETKQNLTSLPLNDGVHYAHVRSVASSGFASETAHFGPFIIDTKCPNVLGIAITPNPIDATQTLLVQVAVSDL